MIRAILRAQLLSLRPRRGSVGIGVVVMLVWYGFWIFAGCWAAYYTSRTALETLRFTLPIGLMGVCLYWQAMPVLSASMGAGLDLRKLLLYPVPHQRLFAVELLLRLTSGVEMVLVLTGGAAGLVWNPAVGPNAVPIAAATVLIFIAFNVAMASGTRSLMERLLSRRKIREIVALLMALLWMGPRTMMMLGIKPKWLHSGGEFAGTGALPWGAAANALLSRGHPASVLGWAFLSLLLWTAVALWFGRTQFERNIRYDALAAHATVAPTASRSNALAGLFYRLPSLLWRDPLAAIIEKELRSLARSPRFRMVFVMGFSFGLMVWLPMVVGRSAAHSGTFSSHFLTIVCVYAMTLMGQVTYWNCFGLDRSAVVFYFIAPQPLRRTLLGKNIACLFFIYMQTLVLAGITLAVRVSFGLGQLIETAAVVGVCAIYLMALGNIASVRYPVAIKPERVSQGGSGNKMQVLLMLLYPIALLPVVLAYVARYALRSQIAFSAVLAMAAAIGVMIYWIAMESAVHAAAKLRQNMLTELSKGDGPVAG